MNAAGTKIKADCQTKKAAFETKTKAGWCWGLEFCAGITIYAE